MATGENSSLPNQIRLLDVRAKALQKAELPTATKAKGPKVPLYPPMDDKAGFHNYCTEFFSETRRDTEESAAERTPPRKVRNRGQKRGKLSITEQVEKEGEREGKGLSVRRADGMEASFSRPLSSFSCFSHPKISVLS